MGKKMTKLVLALGAMAMAGGAMAETVPVTASATVITPLYFAPDGVLKFGKFTPSRFQNGTVVVTPAAVRSATGGVGLMPDTATVPTFTMAGQADASYTVTLPASATLTSSGNTLTVSSFTSSAALTGVLPTVLGEGRLLFTVGATLAVPADTPPGAYVGEFSVTAVYN